VGHNWGRPSQGRWRLNGGFEIEGESIIEAQIAEAGWGSWGGAGPVPMSKGVMGKCCKLPSGAQA